MTAVIRRIRSALTAPRPVASRPRVLPTGWVALLALTFMVASEYNFRRRAQNASLAGAADNAVVLELIAYGLGAAFLIFQLVEPPRRGRLHPLLLVLWGFTLTMLLTAFWSPFTRLAVGRGVQLAACAALGHLAARHASPAALARLCHAYVALIVASIAVGVVVPYPTLPQAAGRFTWFYTHPNISGVFIAIGLVVTLALLLRRRAGVPGASWPVGTYAVLFLIELGALLATRSRGSFAAAALGLAALAFATARGRNRLDLVVIGIPVLVIVWAMAATDLLAFWERGESAEQLGTLNSRTRVWGQAWELFVERPLLGHGFMSARGAFLDAFGLGGAHNALFEVMVNSGLLGFAWWAALLVLAVREAVRLSTAGQPDGPLLAGVLGALLGSTLTAGGLGQAATVQSVWLCLVVGWLAAARHLRWQHPDTTPPAVPPLATRFLAAAPPPPRAPRSGTATQPLPPRRR